ncbi:MAG: hypothetical protein ACP5HM_10095 [Anaerolineae bacterium]
MENTVDAPQGKTQAPTQPVGWAWTWLPVTALLGGAWAYGAPLEALPSTGLALALVLGGWMPLWRAITTTDWRTPLRRWRTWRGRVPLPRWPYLQPGTPGAALHHALEHAWAWWRDVGAPALGPSLRSAFGALALSVLVGAVLGRTALLLSVFLLTCAELATLWHEGEGHVGSGWEALGWVGLPWLLGASLNGSMPLAAWLSALAVTLLVGFQAVNRGWSVLGPLSAAVFLLWGGHTLAVGSVLLLALPGWLLLLEEVPLQRYRRAVAPWLLLTLLLMAGALR